jgi:hypothetical protein
MTPSNPRLTVEEAMKQSGLEKFVNDKIVRELLEFNDNEFNKFYFCSKRTAVRYLKILKMINPEGLPADIQSWHHSSYQKTIQQLKNLELVKVNRKSYQVLVNI